MTQTACALPGDLRSPERSSSRPRASDVLRIGHPHHDGQRKVRRACARRARGVGQGLRRTRAGDWLLPAGVGAEAALGGRGKDSRNAGRTAQSAEDADCLTCPTGSRSWATRSSRAAESFGCRREDPVPRPHDAPGEAREETAVRRRITMPTQYVTVIASRSTLIFAVPSPTETDSHQT